MTTDKSPEAKSVTRGLASALVSEGGFLSSLVKFLPQLRTPLSLAGLGVVACTFVFTSNFANAGRVQVLMAALGVCLLVFAQLPTVLQLIPKPHRAIVAVVLFAVFSGTSVALGALAASEYVRNSEPSPDPGVCNGVSLTPRTPEQLLGLAQLDQVVNKRVDLSERYKDYLRAEKPDDKAGILAEIRAKVNDAIVAHESFPQAHFRFHDFIFRHHNLAWCHLLKAQSALKEDVRKSEAAAAIRGFDLAIEWIRKTQECAQERKLEGLAETVKWARTETIHEWATWNRIDARLIQSSMGDKEAEQLAAGEIAQLRAFCRESSSDFMEDPILRYYAAWNR